MWSGVGLEVNAYVFPTTATDYFALHTRRIGIIGIPPDVGVHIVLEVIGAFIVERRGPLGHVTRHAIQTEVVGPVSIRADSVETTVFGIVTATRFEVGDQTAASTSKVVVTPGIHGLRTTATGGRFPLCFGV